MAGRNVIYGHVIPIDVYSHLTDQKIGTGFHLIGEDKQDFWCNDVQGNMLPPMFYDVIMNGEPRWMIWLQEKQ